MKAKTKSGIEIEGTIEEISNLLKNMEKDREAKDEDRSFNTMPTQIKKIGRGHHQFISDPNWAKLKDDKNFLEFLRKNYVDENLTLYKLYDLVVKQYNIHISRKALNEFFYKYTDIRKNRNSSRERRKIAISETKKVHVGGRPSKNHPQNVIDYIIRNYYNKSEIDIISLVRLKFGCALLGSDVRSLAAKYKLRKSKEYLSNMTKQKFKEVNAKIEKSERYMIQTKICVDCHQVFRKENWMLPLIWIGRKWCRNCAMKHLNIARGMRWEGKNEKKESENTNEIVDSVEFPDLKNLNPLFKPIFQGIVERSIKSNGEITFQETSYATEIITVREWKEFVEDFMIKSGMIANYFKMPNNFKLVGYNIRYGG